MTSTAVSDAANAIASEVRVYERIMVFSSALGIVTMLSASVLVLLTYHDPLGTTAENDVIDHLVLAPYFFFGFCPSWVVQTILLWWSQRLGESRKATILFNWILFGVVFLSGIVYSIFNLANYTVIKANFPTNPLATRERIQMGKIYALVFLGIGFGAFFPLVYATLHGRRHVKVSFTLLALQTFLFSCATLLLCILQFFLYAELGRVSTAYLVISVIVGAISVILIFVTLLFLFLGLKVGQFTVQATAPTPASPFYFEAGGATFAVRPVSQVEATTIQASGQRDTVIHEERGQRYAVTTLSPAAVTARRAALAAQAAAARAAPPAATGPRAPTAPEAAAAVGAVLASAPAPAPAAVFAPPVDPSGGREWVRTSS